MKLFFEVESDSEEETGRKWSEEFITDALSAFSCVAIWNMLISGGSFSMVSAT